jgi:hypothetical protein
VVCGLCVRCTEQQLLFHALVTKLADRSAVLGRYLVLRLNRARPILSLAPFPLFIRTELTLFFHTDDLLYRAGLKVSADSSRIRRRRKVLERKLEDDLARTCRSSLG